MLYCTHNPQEYLFKELPAWLKQRCSRKIQIIKMLFLNWHAFFFLYDRALLGFFSVVCTFCLKHTVNLLTKV